MKYVLYRFPNAVRYSDTSDPELYGFFKFPVQGQVVGVKDIIRSVLLRQSK